MIIPIRKLHGAKAPNGNHASSRHFSGIVPNRNGTVIIRIDVKVNNGILRDVGRINPKRAMPLVFLRLIITPKRPTDTSAGGERTITDDWIEGIIVVGRDSHEHRPNQPLGMIDDHIAQVLETT